VAQYPSKGKVSETRHGEGGDREASKAEERGKGVHKRVDRGAEKSDLKKRKNGRGGEKLLQEDRATVIKRDLGWRKLQETTWKRGGNLGLEGEKLYGKGNGGYRS